MSAQPGGTPNGTLPLSKKFQSRWRQAVLEGAQQMGRGNRHKEQQGNHVWLETKEIFRAAQPRHRCPESLECLHPWRYSHGQGQKQHHLSQKSTCFEVEWDSKTQEITLSFSSYHSSFMKRKVTLQGMFMKLALGINRKIYQSIVLYLSKVIPRSPGLRNFLRTRLSVWSAVSLSWDVNSSCGSWFLGAMGGKNIKVLTKKTVHLLHQCLL